MTINDTLITMIRIPLYACGDRGIAIQEVIMITPVAAQLGFARTTSLQFTACSIPTTGGPLRVTAHGCAHVGRGAAAHPRLARTALPRPVPVPNPSIARTTHVCVLCACGRVCSDCSRHSRRTILDPNDSHGCDGSIPRGQAWWTVLSAFLWFLYPLPHPRTSPSLCSPARRDALRLLHLLR
jgi:hypothetical protein